MGQDASLPQKVMEEELLKTQLQRKLLTLYQVKASELVVIKTLKQSKYGFFFFYNNNNKNH